MKFQAEEIFKGNWTVHTDQELMVEQFDTAIPGVEYMVKETRYTFTVHVGILFDANEVIISLLNSVKLC